MKASNAPHKRPAYGVTQDLTDVPADAPDDALDEGGWYINNWGLASRN
jgi:hypothetical protein